MKNISKTLGLFLILACAPAFAQPKTVVVKHSGLCLDVAGNSYSDGANIQQFRCHYGKNQKFEFTLQSFDYDGNPLYNVVAQNSGKCIEVCNSSLYDLANIQQACCDDTAKQLFRLDEVEKYGKIFFQIVNQNSGKCLDIHRANKYNNGNLIQYACHGRDNQLFTIE